MREIKFRLRDRHNKIVGYEKWYGGQWHPDNPDEGFAIDSGYWEASPCWLYSVDGEHWTPTFIPHAYKDQYTGLKDSKACEIYEGDIFKITEEPPEINKVAFENGTYWLVPHGLELFNFSTSGEVIGNIYENPELLKEV